jgi:hypothetical protein
VLSCGVVKDADHVPRGEDDLLGHAGDTKPGVVVDEVDDLDLALVGEVHVGDVGLPQLIGQVRPRSAQGSTWGAWRARAGRD